MLKKKGLMFDGNKKITLVYLLSFIPENNWKWLFFEFSGVGNIPAEMSMAEFEDAVTSIANGYPMNWRQLNNFANGLIDINDCLLIAVDPAENITREDIQGDILQNYFVIVKIFDGTEWEILMSVENFVRP